MASETVSAFQLYFMDNIDCFKKSSNSINEAYDNAKKEWEQLPKDVATFYIKKEINLNQVHNFVPRRLRFISHFFNNEA